MAKIHLILGSKGGIGKSLIAYFLAQYLLEKKGAFLGFDTDLHNKTFASYPALKVQPLDLVDEKTEKVKPSAFDLVFEAAGQMTDGDIVIDVGASSFQPFTQYQMEMDLAGTWADMGHQLVLHLVVAGGKSFEDTLATFGKTMGSFHFGKSVKAVVWRNDFNGPTEVNRVDFTDLDVYKQFKKQVSHIATLPVIEGLFKDCLEKLTSECLIFSEVAESKKFMMAEKARVTRIKNWVYDVLDSIECIL